MTLADSCCLFDWSRGGPECKPIASRQRVGEVAFLIKAMLNPTQMMQHADEFVRVERDV